jgi:1-deoxy-D-xylulose-5-phosphate reductoisomerase
MNKTGTTLQRVTILGATGSIGVNTLRVIAAHRHAYEVFALTANRNTQLLLEQCVSFNPRFAVTADELQAAELRQQLRSTGCLTEVLCGVDGLVAVASAAEVDAVMAAIVGGAGLLPTLAAARAGKKVLLANKEALVMAGELFTRAAVSSGARILPIDSEHNAIFQCLPIDRDGRFDQNPGHGFSKIVLTASGGPFRDADLASLAQVTPDQACAHPNWKMGRKISVDSATMINKALELIEASYLFDTPANSIEILIHPQSIVHSMVYYRDGSVLAQLGNPDMRTPIAYGLAWPQRIDAGVLPLDLAALGRLDFTPADPLRFPGLTLGRQAAESRGAAPIVFNAANEIAVASFLAGQLGFPAIPVIIDQVLQRLDTSAPSTLDDVLDIDRRARTEALARLSAMAHNNGTKP